MTLSRSTNRLPAILRGAQPQRLAGVVGTLYRQPGRHLPYVRTVASRSCNARPRMSSSASEPLTLNSVEQRNRSWLAGIRDKQ